MKKIICLSLVILSTAGSAFAFTTLPTGTPTTAAAAVKGGADQATAEAAATPLIQFSTGVSGMVNFVADTTNPKTCAGYLIAARHTSGSKNFATSNSLPNVYWKQATKVDATHTLSANMIADIKTDPSATVTFAAGQGWTSY